MKKVFSLLLVLFVAGFAAQALGVTLEDIKKQGYVDVGIFPEVEPFEFYDTNGNRAGFDIDLIEAVAKIWGIKVKYHDKVWPELIPSLLAKEFDVIAAPMTITTKRAMIITFTMPHFEAGQMVVVQSDNQDIKDYRDLKGKRVAVIKGSTCEEAAKSIGATIVSSPSAEECLRMLMDREVIAHVIDRPFAMTNAKNSNGKLKVVGKPFTVENYGYAVRKDDSELLMQLNRAITILKNDGIYDALIDKWFK